MNAKSLGLTIAKLRKKCNLTQAQLAKKLNISDKTVSRWENGLGFPEITQLPRLASIFGVSIDYIMNSEHKGITIIGNILTDIVKKIDTYPKIGELSHIKSISRSVGGCAPNTAINLAKIDRTIPISVIGKIGDDEYGRYILSQLSRYHINCEKIVVSPDSQTSFCDAMTLPSGESTFFHTVGSNAQFSTDDIDVFSLHCSILHLGYVLPLGDFDREIPFYGTAVAKLLHNAQDRGIKTSLNIMNHNLADYKQKVIPLLKYCDYVIFNESEVSVLCDIEDNNPDYFLNEANVANALRFISECGVKEKIIIHCKDASFCYNITSNKVSAVPTLIVPQNKIKSDIGIGDAFCAGCLYGIYNKFEDQHILDFALSAAACNLFSENSVDGMQDKNEIEKLSKKYR